jgi:hypothetical protein
MSLYAPIDEATLHLRELFGRAERKVPEECTEQKTLELSVQTAHDGRRVKLQ